MNAVPFVLKASSVGRTASKRVAREGPIGRVHSVFARAINIVTNDDRMIALVDGSVGKGPINIVTPVPRGLTMALLGVRDCDALLRAGGTLVVEDRGLIISLNHASLYRPRRNLGGAVLPGREIRHNLTLVKQCARYRGSSEMSRQLMDHLLSRRSSGALRSELNPFARAALPYLSALVLAISKGDHPRVRMATENLVGLGPGLTPSADDILTGLMVTLRWVVANQTNIGGGITGVLKEMVSSIPGRTTPLSEEFLILAASGEANEPVVRLLRGILTAGGDEAVRATKRLLAVGGPSGTDLLLGVLLGFELTLGERFRGGGGA